MRGAWALLAVPAGVAGPRPGAEDAQRAGRACARQGRSVFEPDG